MTQLSAARAGVFEALSEATEAITVQELAQRLGQHPNTVREHLEVIVDAGLASRTRSTANRRGRPAILYRALPPESSRPQVREYSALATVLAAQLASLPDPRGAALAAGRAWGEELGTSGPAGSQGARDRTLTVLGHLGFDPVPLVDERADGEVELRECPLLEAAKAHPGVVCAVHLGLVRALYEGQGMPGDEVKLRLRTGTVVTTDDRNWELRYSKSALRFNQSRAVAIDMESATIAAQGYRFRVPYGTLLCVSDKPLHGEIKLPGMANHFYRERVEQHLRIGMAAIEILRAQGPGRLHSRKLRSFAEVAFQ